MMRGLSLCTRTCVCASVCLSVGHDREPYKTAEPIEVLFEIIDSDIGPHPKNHVLAGGPGPGSLQGKG